MKTKINHKKIERLFSQIEELSVEAESKKNFNLSKPVKDITTTFVTQISKLSEEERQTYVRIFKEIIDSTMLKQKKTAKLYKALEYALENLE